MAWFLRQILQETRGSSWLEELLIGMLLGLPGGLFLGHLNDLLLEYWTLHRTSLQTLLYFLTGVLCMDIDIVSSATAFTVGSQFIQFCDSRNVQTLNLVGLVCVVAAAGTGAILGTIMFSYPWIWGVLFVLLKVLLSRWGLSADPSESLACRLSGVWTFNVFGGICICLFYAGISSYKEIFKYRTYVNEHIHCLIIMYATSLKYALTLIVLEKMFCFIRFTVLLKIILPPQCFVSCVGVSGFSSNSLVVCVASASWGVVVLCALMFAVPKLSVGASIGAVMGVLGAFRVSVAAAGAVVGRGEETRIWGVTIGATAGSLLMSCLY
ncbi:uncharacterized protein LOC117393687 [Periophthalmus magnuspinnatus]|uniref:uncharacterized protein LOC117393687 n=1 Tax=Periophthalmus magnuspinnatus TaxID=409849 RepID=UPI00145A87D6|nr:uncharacterized protein LOC117393687 [Periophthalmus magnuspinnatus]